MMYRSTPWTTAPVTASAPHYFEMGFLPALDSRLRRNYIEQIMIEVQYSVTTGAGVTSNGGHFRGRLVENLQVTDRSGEDIVNLPGYLVRALDYYEKGDDAEPDGADIPAGGPSTGTVYLVLDFSPPNDVEWGVEGIGEGRNFLLPVDDLGKIKVTMPSPGGLAFTGGDPTVTSLTYTLYVKTRSFDSVDAPARRILKYVSTGANLLDKEIPIQGGFIRNVFEMVSSDTASGGASFATLTELAIPELGFVNIARLAQLRAFARERRIAITPGTVGNNPFADGLSAVPILFPRRKGAIEEYHRVMGNLLYRYTGSTVASTVALVDLIVPRTRASHAGTVARSGLKVPMVNVQSRGVFRPAAEYGALANVLPGTINRLSNTRIG